MLESPHACRASRWAALVAWLIGGLASLGLAAVSSTETKRFAIPASTADKSLKLFAAQSGFEVVYPADLVRGVTTREVRGELTPAAAVQRLLEGTPLSSSQDARSGAFSIARRPDPNGSRAAQKTPGDRPTSPGPSKPTPPQHQR